MGRWGATAGVSLAQASKETKSSVTQWNQGVPSPCVSLSLLSLRYGRCQCPTQKKGTKPAEGIRGFGEDALSTSVAEVLRRAYLGRRVTLIVKLSDTFSSGAIIHALWTGQPCGAAYLETV